MSVSPVWAHRVISQGTGPPIPAGDLQYPEKRRTGQTQLQAVLVRHGWHRLPDRCQTQSLGSGTDCKLRLVESAHELVRTLQPDHGRHLNIETVYQQLGRFIHSAASVVFLLQDVVRRSLAPSSCFDCWVYYMIWFLEG